MKSTTLKYTYIVKGGYTAAFFASYRLPVSMVTAVVGAANLLLAKTTWSTYKTAESHLKRCEAETGVRIRFPMNDQMILTYVGWLITYRRVCSNTISQYLSALRVIHLKNGVFPPNLKPDIVKTIITGHASQFL